jgi:citrate synthase
METKNVGLRDIPVADTKISCIDGEKGKLIYRGYDILDLTRRSNFEETCYLLLHDNMPNKKQLDNFSKLLKEARMIAPQMQKNMGNWRKDAHPMDVLQAFVAALAGYYHESGTEREISLQRAINLIAKVPTIIANWDMIRNEKEIIQPDTKLNHAANFLYMLTGERPEQDVEKIFDICLILHADHTFNASTFAAREVASTRAHMYSAVSAAVGALSGELHGGANQEVMKMLLEIKTEENATNWLEKRISDGNRIMGMGHAVYKTVDPRSLVLKELSKKLSKITQQKWFDITNKIENETVRIMKENKSSDIFPNVDLYSASVYYMLGIPMDLNTPIFALSRVSGWCAHVIEEKFAEAAPKPMLYRPKANYVGKYDGPQGSKYIPIEER